MKIVHTSDMVAHLWANQAQAEARESKRQTYFEGRTLYSYGSHYVIGHFLTNGTLLWNSTSSTNTTNGRRSAAWRALTPEQQKNCIELPGLTAGNVQDIEDAFKRGGRLPRQVEMLLEFALENAAEATRTKFVSGTHKRSVVFCNQKLETYRRACKLFKVRRGIKDFPARDSITLREAFWRQASAKEYINSVIDSNYDYSRIVRMGSVPTCQYVKLKCRSALDLLPYSTGRKALRPKLEELHLKAVRRMREIAAEAREGEMFLTEQLREKTMRILLGHGEEKHGFLSDAIAAHSLGHEEGVHPEWLAKFGPLIRSIQAKVMLRTTVAHAKRLRSRYETLCTSLEENTSEVSAGNWSQWSRYSSPDSRLSAEVAKADQLLLEMQGRLPCDEEDLPPGMRAHLFGVCSYLASAPAIRKLKELSAFAASTLKQHEEGRLERWLSGSTVYNDRPEATTARVVGKDVETSKGATVPLDQAYRFAKIARRIIREGGKAWTDGLGPQVGHFRVKRISGLGEAVIGCHHFSAEEGLASLDRIERAGALLALEENHVA